MEIKVCESRKYGKKTFYWIEIEKEDGTILKGFDPFTGILTNKKKEFYLNIARNREAECNLPN